VLFSFFRRQAAEERATMRSKTVILLVLALGCGLVASIGISQILQKQDQTPSGDTAPVWAGRFRLVYRVRGPHQRRRHSAHHAEF
jgi:hypothetical protein